MMNEEHEEREDSYGCGIDECFPCSSSDGLEKSKLNEMDGVNVRTEIQSIIRHPPNHCPPFSSFSSSSVSLSEEKGSDYPFCGTSKYPCSSLVVGESHFNNENNEKSFILLSSFSFSSSYSNEKELEIKSNQNNEFSLTLKNGENQIFQNKNSLSFINIDFDISLSEGNTLSSILLSSSPSSLLSFSSSSFSSSSSSFSLPLVTLEYGELRLEEVKIEGEDESHTLSASSFFFSFSSSSSVYFSFCSFDFLSFPSSSSLFSFSLFPFSFSIQHSNLTNFETSLSSPPLFFSIILFSSFVHFI
jgi:hypothetical protein